MKSPEEYLNKVSALTLREDLYKIGKQMQIDAYNQAIEDALECVPDYELQYIDIHDYSCGTEPQESIIKKEISELKIEQ